MSKSGLSVATGGRHTLKRLGKKSHTKTVPHRRRNIKPITVLPDMTEQSTTQSEVMLPQGDESNSSLGTLSSPPSDCVDLTAAANDSLIDLTDQSPFSMRLPLSPSLNSTDRPSCRYAATPGSPQDVVFLHSTQLPNADNDVIIVNSTLPSLSHTLPEKRRKKYSSPPSLPQPPITTTNDASPKPLTCPVCLETVTQFRERGSKLVTTICGHVFCSSCIRNAISTLHKCPTCRKTLTLKQYHQLYL